MSQRKAGRPSGTDGSDFSYRMVVDSRYTKVAKGKSVLQSLMLTQGFIQLLELLVLLLPTSVSSDLDVLALWSVLLGFVVLLIGEYGRWRSRASLLLIYAACSLAGMLLSTYCAKSRYTFTLLDDSSDWQTKKVRLVECLLFLTRSLVQIYALVTGISLIRNMTPPKKTL